MKKLLTLIGLLVLIFQAIGLLSYLKAQPSFDVNIYKQFLSTHQNLSTNQLYDLHPAGLFAFQVADSNITPIYLDSIEIKYQLTNSERLLLSQHGFMVTERLSYQSFGQALLDIWHKDLPVFISTDAILHALHMSYDKILIDVERDILIPKLDTLLFKLHSQLSVLASQYSSNTSMTQMLRDVDVYLTIPRKLLGNTVSPYYPENEPVVNELLNYINAEQPAEYPLFSSVNRTIDFSQFTVRGHYTSQEFPQLAKYFKAMMWLGRTEVYLLPPRSLDEPPTPNDIKRQTIDAVLILEAAQLANAFPLLDEIDSIIKFFVGESDNVTLPHIQELITACNITSASQLLDDLILQNFQDTLKLKSYAFQRILSQILFNDMTNPDSIVPASAFLLLGQRFIIDSYITSQVVYDRITYNGSRVARMLPSTLDVLFALGNDASAQLLQSELDQYHYGTNLAALRYLVDSYEPEFWDSSLFNLWLNAIRTLNPPTDRYSFPPFMKTAAWWQEKMNTQLASWAQLRHDNLLYAKQSYTGGIVCSYPYSYVEPIPAFYNAIKRFAQIAIDRFQPITFNEGYIKTAIINYFNKVVTTTDTLSVIAQKELDNIALTLDEERFLKKMLYEQDLCGVPYSGWYVKLFYNDYGSGDQLMKEDRIVADIHTAPTDAAGNPIGWVLHAGTGKINLGVFVSQIPGGQNTAFVGPVMSYHEYLSTNFLRLTDEEWNATYLNASIRPSFINLYLADTLGSSRGPGINLFTSTENQPIRIPKTFVLHRNYPNPFNSSTVISYTIPDDLAYAKVELNVYNIHGQLVKKLLNSVLAARTYLTRWDGTDENGINVPSGIYFYKLKVGNNFSIGKMSLIK